MVNRQNMSLRETVLARKPLSESMCSSTNSPLPTPIFKQHTFSTKKERQTPRDHPPPTPRPRTSVKNNLPVSRLFANSVHEGPQSISFIESQSRLSTKHYDENSKKLYFNQCFDVICKLGSGSFGEVFKVLCKEDNKFYAIKRSKECFKGKSDRLRKLEEVKKHEQLPKHPNCVQFFKAWEERDHLYIQTELCRISLCEYSDENHDIPESTVWDYLIDLLLAVKHLHDHDLIHLDIKPENIFISENGVCKLGDFGLVLDVSKGDVNDASEGDPKYLAPELMQGIFTKAADIFSLGITVLELACDLDLPRGDTAWHQLRHKQIPQDFVKRISPSLREVITLMMEPDYTKRPSVNFILQIDAVKRHCRKRVQMLKLKALASCFTHIYNLAVQFSSWLKSVFFRILPFCHKESELVLTPQHKDQAKFSPEFDYSFSDEDVFEMNQSDKSFGDVCSVLFKDSDGNGSLSDSDDEMRCKFMPLHHRFAERATSTPSSERTLQPFPDSPTVRNLRSSPKANSGSVRRSPRLAAKQSCSDPHSEITINPRNLLAEFENEALKM